MAERALADKKQASVGVAQTVAKSLCSADTGFNSEDDQTPASPPHNNQLFINEMYDTLPPEPAVDAQ